MKRNFERHEEHGSGIISLAGEGIERGLYPVSKEWLVDLDEKNDEAGAGSREPGFGDKLQSGWADFILGTYSQESTRIEKSSLLLTTGRMEAWKLLLGELVNPGDTVVVENPVSPAVLKELLLRQVKVVPIDCDGAGMRPEELKSCLVRIKPALIYITLGYSDTTGAIWSSARIREIAEITRQAGIWLVGDRSSAEAPFAAGTNNLRKSGSSLFEIGRDRGYDGRIAELMSMDGHGIHAGWVRAGETLIQRLKEAREALGSAEDTRGRWTQADKALIERLKEARGVHGSAEDISRPAGVPAQLLVQPGFSWAQHAAALNREYAARRAEALAVLAGSRALGCLPARCRPRPLPVGGAAGRHGQRRPSSGGASEGRGVPARRAVLRGSGEPADAALVAGCAEPAAAASGAGAHLRSSRGIYGTLAPVARLLG